MAIPEASAWLASSLDQPPGRGFFFSEHPEHRQVDRPASEEPPPLPPLVSPGDTEFPSLRNRRWGRRSPGLANAGASRIAASRPKKHTLHFTALIVPMFSSISTLVGHHG